MNLITLLLTVCAIDAPTLSCHEVGLQMSAEQVTLTQCSIAAQQIVAIWEEQNIKYRVESFRCTDKVHGQLDTF